MGARGPRAKPPELKLLEGGRGKRPVDLSVHFRPHAGVPDAPKWLTLEAKKAWRRLSNELSLYNLLSKVDRDALAQLCQTIGRLEMLERALAGRMAQCVADGAEAAEALLDKTPNGMQIQSALYQVLKREQDTLTRLIAEFGLTPAQRARVSTAAQYVAANQLTLFNGQEPDPPPEKPKSFAEFD